MLLLAFMRYYRIYYGLWKRVMRYLGRWNYNDYSSAHAVGIITALQVANAFYLIEEVFFTDARRCGACDPSGRLNLLAGAMAGIYVANNVLFWREQPDSFTPLSRRAKWGWGLATIVYCAGSVYLVV